MLLQKGEKLCVAFRKRFENEKSRIFAGAVVATTGTIARVEGYEFLRDPATGTFLRTPGLRHRFISLVGNETVIDVIPQDVPISALSCVTGENGQPVLSDNVSFHFIITEP